MKINTLILAASIVLSFGSQAAEKQYTITKPCNFPVKPGPRAWAQLADSKAACEVPAKVLEAMTTEALLQTCMDYPFKPDPKLFSDLHQIPEHCFNCFDGFKELATRPDAGQFLVQYYALLSKALEKASSIVSPDYQFYLDIHFFHELLHASRITPLFNPAQKEQLAKLALKNVVTLESRPADRNTGIMPGRLALRLLIRENVVVRTSTGTVDKSGLPAGAFKYVNGESIVGKDKEWFAQFVTFAARVRPFPAP